MSKCRGIKGWILGHNFVPVYHEEPVVVQKEAILTNRYGDQDFQKAKTETKRTYVQSVCSRCGEVAINTDVLNS